MENKTEQVRKAWNIPVGTTAIVNATVRMDPGSEKEYTSAKGYMELTLAEDSFHTETKIYVKINTVDFEEA